MRMVTITYPVYQFAELSTAAKEKVRNWYSETQDPAIFTMQCNEDLDYLFPESNLHVEYSLGYCQGDGLNIYGKLYLDELMENMMEVQEMVYQWEMEKVKNWSTETIKNYIWLDVSCGQPIPGCVSVEALRAELAMRGQDTHGYHNT